jgi:uncharacterized membrane protein
VSFESGKSIASIGALLLVVGSFVPFLSIVGIILLLIGMKNLAEYYKENSIFQNALYAVIFGIIGIVAAGFVLLSLFFGGAFMGMSGAGGVLGLAVGVILVLVVVFIFYVLMAVYFRRAFDSLADKTGEGMFRTAGLLLFIGAILTIVIVGLILIFVAWILATVAFFSMKTVTTPPPPPPLAP